MEILEKLQHFLCCKKNHEYLLYKLVKTLISCSSALTLNKFNGWNNILIIHRKKKQFYRPTQFAPIWFKCQMCKNIFATSEHKYIKHNMRTQRVPRTLPCNS